MLVLVVGLTYIEYRFQRVEGLDLWCTIARKLTSQTCRHRQATSDDHKGVQFILPLDAEASAFYGSDMSMRPCCVLYNVSIRSSTSYVTEFHLNQFLLRPTSPCKFLYSFCTVALQILVQKLLRPTSPIGVLVHPLSVC